VSKSQLPTYLLTAPVVVNSGDYLTAFINPGFGTVYTSEAVLSGLINPTLNWLGWKTIASNISSDPSNLLLGFEISAITGVGGGVEIATDSLFVSIAPPHPALSSPGGTPIDNDFANADLITNVAYHQVVSTLGVEGRPVVFTIGSDGQVYESEAQGTTIFSHYSDFANIPGLNATSLAATTEPNGIALFALTAGSSLVFENQYRPIGVGSSYAWMGWAPLRGFVATAITAATGGDSASNGPTLFALGLDGNVYAAGSTAPASPSGGYTFASFSVLAGLASSVISVKPTSTGIEVAGLAGPEGNPYVNLDTSGTWSGWQLTGDYVASSVLASNSADGGPAVVATSPTGLQAVSDYKGTSGWAAYQQISFLDFPDGKTSQLDGFASQALPSQAGVVYIDLIRPLHNKFSQGIVPVYPAYSQGNGTKTVGLAPSGLDSSTSVAASPGNSLPTLFIGGGDPSGKLQGRVSVFYVIVYDDPTNPISVFYSGPLGNIPS